MNIFYLLKLLFRRGRGLPPVLCLLILAGCETSMDHVNNESGGMRYESSRLQAVAAVEVDFLSEVFSVSPQGVLKVHPPDRADGAWYYNGDWYLGMVIADVGWVSYQLFPSVIRHELLHLCGYGPDHVEKINGVLVSQYVQGWSD
jgi:hypothetical protein